VRAGPHRARGLAGLQIAVAQHAAGRAEQGRQVHADGAHHRARRGLVATGQQHHAVHRQRAQQLLHLHGQEVAVQHGGGLDHHLAQAHGGQLEGHAAGQQHAALDGLGALAQVRMAGRQIAPGVDDGDDRPLQHILAAQPHLLDALAVREAAHVAGGKPAAASQIGKGSGHDAAQSGSRCYR